MEDDEEFQVSEVLCWVWSLLWGSQHMPQQQLQATLAPIHTQDPEQPCSTTCCGARQSRDSHARPSLMFFKMLLADVLLGETNDQSCLQMQSMNITLQPFCCSLQA